MSCAHEQVPRPPNAVNDPDYVNQMDRSSDSIDREKQRRRALSIVEAYSSGVDNLSANHDWCLAEAYADAAGDE